MKGIVVKLFVAAVTIAGIDSAAAQKPQAPAPTPTPTKVDACSLLTLTEVKQHLPWPKHMDKIAKAEPEDMGGAGSACEYPTVRVQVLPFSRGFLDAAHKGRKPESVPGLGDEASISANRNNYAELAVKVGPRLVTLQASIATGETYETTKPKTIALAKALIPKLPPR